jgi:glycosyltransferase involved in cell wall biosynthesis
MRILQVSSARVFGGGERHLVDLCRELTKRGHEVFVALRPTNLWQNRLDFLPAGNIFHVSIRNSFGVLSAMRVADFIRENKIEIVHAHVARDYIPASIACLAAKPAKFVLTRHVMLPLKPFNRFALKNLSKAIGVSDAVAHEIKRVFPPSRVEVIENGIDLDNFDGSGAADSGREFRELHEIPEDVPLVGTLGELKELKGQRDFVLAAAEVVKEIPDCQFVVVGLDHTVGQPFRRELKRLVGVLGLADRFLWLDWLEDTAPFFSAIDVFVSPSHSESFGLAILEAMARGKAIAATATDGAMTLLGGVAPFAQIEEPVELAEKIVELLGDEDARASLGKALKQRAAEKFSLKRMVDETEKLYQRLLK